MNMMKVNHESRDNCNILKDPNKPASNEKSNNVIFLENKNVFSKFLCLGRRTGQKWRCLSMCVVS